MSTRPKITGLTLIEVLIAMVILTIALLAGSTLIVASHTATIKGDLYNIANRSAADAIASYEANGYSSLPSSLSTQSVTYPLPGIMMTTTTTIGTPQFSSSATNIKQIDVVVTWTSGSSASANLAGQIKASTLISNA